MCSQATVPVASLNQAEEGFYAHAGVSACLQQKSHCDNGSCTLNQETLQKCIPSDAYAAMVPIDLKTAPPIKPLVSGYIIKDQGVGYLQIRQFAWPTDVQTRNMLQRLTEEHPKLERLFLDLRGNNGGYVHVVNNIINLFSPAKDAPMYTVKMREVRKNYRTRDRGAFAHLIVIVLVDHDTASAAEIAAGVLQRWGHIVSGERTYGKGIVQSRFPAGECLLQLTTGMIVFPDGSSYHKIGILPNIQIDTKNANLPDLALYFTRPAVAAAPAR